MEVKRPTRTLHEAIRLVLERVPKRTASTAFIAEEISRRKLYLQKSGKEAFPEQIFLRARRYPKWFEIIDRQTIRLLTIK